MKKETIKTALTFLILLIVISGVILGLKGDNILNRVLGQSTGTQEPPSPTPQVTTLPSERALKAATYVYYADNGANQGWINKAYPLADTQIDNFRAVTSQKGYSETEIEAEIKRKQEEEAITKLAMWLDTNPNYLVAYEVGINKHQQSLQNQYVQQPQYVSNNQDDANEQLYRRNLQYKLDEQESKLNELQREEQKRNLWDSVCAVTGQEYNSFVGGGCR